MLHVVLFQPEIPQNTGNIGRMCAFGGLRLHLIHPLGFTITDRHLRRSGMDYWRALDVNEHEDFAAFQNSDRAPKRLWLFSTKATRSLWDASFEDGDGLVFGRESSGSPAWLHELLDARRLKVPQLGQGLRSLNLSTCAGIAAYEALRQLSTRKGSPCNA